MAGLYKKFIRKFGANIMVTPHDLVAEYLFGYDLRCNNLWINVDHVLIPMNVDSNHWILGCFHIKKRAFMSTILCETNSMIPRQRIRQKGCQC